MVNQINSCLSLDCLLLSGKASGQSGSELFGRDSAWFMLYHVFFIVNFVDNNVSGNVSFTLTTYVSSFKANTLANWNAVSRQIWRGCHTSVDSGDLNQAPPKQSAVCSTCII